MAVVAADAVLLVDRKRIAFGKQPALGLRQVQADGGGLAAVGEQLPDVFHLRPRPVLFGQLLQRYEGRRQRFDDDPLVVSGDSFSRHRLTPQIVATQFWPEPTVIAIEPLLWSASVAVQKSASCLPRVVHADF